MSNDNKKSHFDFIDTSIFVFLMFLLSIVVSCVLFFVIDLFVNDDDITTNGLLVSISGFITVVFTWFFIVKHITANLSVTLKNYLAFLPIKLFPLIIWIFITLSFVILYSSIANYFNFSIKSNFLNDLYSSTDYGWVVIIFTVFGAPFIEETIYRGYMYAGFVKSVGVIKTIFLTSLIWAILHLQYDFYQILNVFIFGLILGCSRYKTNSIIMPLILHIMLNALAVIEMLFVGV